MRDSFYQILARSANRPANTARLRFSLSICGHCCSATYLVLFGKQQYNDMHFRQLTTLTVVFITLGTGMSLRPTGIRGESVPISVIAAKHKTY